MRRARNIGLSKEEKNAVKRSVLNFVSDNPPRLGVHPHFNYGSNIFLTKLSFVPSMIILLVIMVSVGGGAAIGAEKAMPGDVLYPVKLNVNEEVRGWLKISDEAKADWEIKRTERRLEEVEELADEGALNEEAREKIEASFEAHAQRVQERVAKFRNKDNFNAAASVSLNFETALQAHEKILSKIADNKSDAGERVKPIRVKIQSRVRESAKERGQINVELRNRDLNIEEREDVDNDNNDEKEDNDEKEREDLNMEIKTGR